MKFAHAATLALTLAASAPLFAADQYWTYSAGQIEVTSNGTNGYTVNLARYCLRLDTLVSRILSIKTAYRPPVHLYSVSEADMRSVTGSPYGSVFQSARNAVSVVLVTPPRAADYWGAYFGYVAALLASDRLLGGPDWYMVGVPSVFAQSEFEHGRVRLGTIPEGYAIDITRAGGLIPMRTFLSLKQHDMEQKGPHELDMFDAQAWFVAHEIFVEGKHRAEFGKYLDLMRQGTAEADAFKASFAISYEDLDKELWVLFHTRPMVYTMDAPEDPSASNATAQPISPAEFHARLALAAVDQKGPSALQLAQAAAQADPGNERALRALARAQLEARAYSDALATLDRLASRERSADACTDSADVLVRLARAVHDGEAQLPQEPAALLARAKQDYERALALNSEDREARYGLAALSRQAGG
jgi:hypothetical protein